MDPVFHILNVAPRFFMDPLQNGDLLAPTRVGERVAIQHTQHETSPFGGYNNTLPYYSGQLQFGKCYCPYLPDGYGGINVAQGCAN